MIKVRLFFLALLVPAVAFAWQIKGKIKDFEGKPLANVTVTLLPEGLAATSDSQGNFAIFPDAAHRSGDSLTLVAEAPQFYAGRRQIRLKSDVTIVEMQLIPMKLLKEEITVTALNEEEKAVAIPFAQSVTSQIAIRENQPESPVAAIANTPGVQFIGKGGISVTPSIRGLARRRILLLVDGSRVVSDRSAGASASFVPPEFIQRIEVVRSAASVLYGSDAIGGVIHIITDKENPAPGWAGGIDLAGDSASGRLGGSVALARQWRDFGFRANLQYVTSGDYRSPAGTVYQSGYSYRTGSFALAYKTAKREFSLQFLKSYGLDVGKPERANDPANYSFYPHESVNLLRLAYREKDIGRLGDFHLQAFINPNSYDLHKVKVSAQQLEISENDSLDAGLRANFRKRVNDRFSFQWGLDCFGRFSVDMENRTSKKGIVVAQSSPLAQGRRGDIGLYATFDYSGLGMFDLVGGARYGYFTRRALSSGQPLDRSSRAPAIFIGLTRKVGDFLTVFFNAATAFRMPSLSEAFYTGITGRTSIVGNPALQPERSLNLDAGVKFFGPRAFLGLYFFQYTISDMIEKFPLSDTAYTYENIEKGRIQGLEVEFQLHPLANVEFFGNAFCYRGRSQVIGQALNDVPSPKALVGGRYWRGRFWVEATWLWSGAMKRPGPAEANCDAYNTVDLKTGLYLSNHWNLFFKAANLGDAFYYPNADPDIPPAKGRSFSAGLSCLF